MTAYTLTFGGTAMPLPDANEQFGMEYFPAVASTRRMWDGSLRQQVTAHRWRWPARFVGLTASEYNTVFQAYLRRVASEGTVVFPNGASMRMMAIAGSWQERHYYNEWTNEVRYDVSFVMEEA